MKPVPELLAPRILLIAVVVATHLAIGAYYLGSTFFTHFATAVPSQPTGGGDVPNMMLPGDHFEQLYRYSLPRHNVAAGKPPYESGYQYNFSADMAPFSEGLVFFPFSAAHLLISTLIGDVAAYNLIALLSFPLVGGAMYWLVFWLTRSHGAALFASLLLALLPHRTSFLLGEMVYGVDLMFPPLIVLFFEKLAQSRALRHVVLFGASLCLYATSSFQAFYFFALFGSPYFIVRGVQFLSAPRFTLDERLRTAGWLVLSLVPALLYLLYVRSLIGASGLSSGQVWQEVRTYSPVPTDALRVWSGNERTIFLGWPFVALVVLALAFGLKSGFEAARRAQPHLATILAMALACFAGSYLFCFGPHLDDALGVGLYRWYFDNVPGASGTRTPGRLMATAGFFFSLAAGVIAYLAVRGWRTAAPRLSPALPLVWVVLAIGVIVHYHYTKPVMVGLEQENAAYEKIRGTKGIVYAIPTQLEAPHYYNASFLYYAQKYDLRFFAGHSSMYPKEWDRIIGDFLPVNAGQLDEVTKRRMVERGITHLAVHATAWEPRVTPFVLARLAQNHHLKRVGEDNGITIFRIDPDATGEASFDAGRFAREAKFGPEDIGKVQHIDGWYDREQYPGEPGFRWMRGVYANVLVYAGPAAPGHVEVSYRCPAGGFGLRVNGENIAGTETPQPGGWRIRRIALAKAANNAYFIEFDTPAVHRAPPDKREFGCMIRDVVLK